MARDYTKYNAEGLGENLNKRKLVFTIVKDWVEKNNPSFEDLQKAFPDEIQGSKGVVKKEAEVKDSKRYNVKEPLKIKNGAHMVVCNQWGEGNIGAFIQCAEKLGYEINLTNDQSVESNINSIIDLTNFRVWKLAQLFSSYESDEAMMNQIDEEIESLIDQDNKFYLVGRLFEKYGFDYHRPEINNYYTLKEDSAKLLDMLRSNSLLEMIIEKENLKNEVISQDNFDFVLKFGAYFLIALETLIERDDKEMVAEFIINQSTSTIEDYYNVDTDSGDWISDVTLEIIEGVLGYELTDYEGECEIDGYYFGQANTMGYDYHGYAQDIIDSMI